MGNDIVGVCRGSAGACARHFLHQGRTDSKSEQIHAQAPSSGSHFEA